MADPQRLEHTHPDLKIGTLYRHEDGQLYVFSGWARNTAGKFAVFKTVERNLDFDPYRVSTTPTFQKRLTRIVEG